MRPLLSTLSLVLLLQGFPVIVQAQGSENTGDVASTAIQQVIAANLMTNSADGNFYPERLNLVLTGRIKIFKQF